MVRELNGLQPLIELITNRGRSVLEDISSNLSERGWAIAALSELARDGSFLASSLPLTQHVHNKKKVNHLLLHPPAPTS